MTVNVSKEIEWKIYVEAGQVYDRMNKMDKATGFMLNAVLNSPDNIKWKVWLVASRTLLKKGFNEQAREIIEKCCYSVPCKQVSFALVEYSKYFELLGKPDRAKFVMQ